MPDCGHSSAVCQIGNFYTCRVVDCSNGPDRPKPQPEVRVRYAGHSDLSADTGFVTAAALGDLQPGIVQLPGGPKIQVGWLSTAASTLSISATGYEFAWIDDNNPRVLFLWGYVVATVAGPQEHGCSLHWRRQSSVQPQYSP